MDFLYTTRQRHGPPVVTWFSRWDRSGLFFCTAPFRKSALSFGFYVCGIPFEGAAQNPSRRVKGRSSTLSRHQDQATPVKFGLPCRSNRDGSATQLNPLLVRLAPSHNQRMSAGLQNTGPTQSQPSSDSDTSIDSLDSLFQQVQAQLQQADLSLLRNEKYATRFPWVLCALNAVLKFYLDARDRGQDTARLSEEVECILGECDFLSLSRTAFHHLQADALVFARLRQPKSSCPGKPVTKLTPGQRPSELILRSHRPTPLSSKS